MVDTSSHYASGLSERLVGRVLREALLRIHAWVFPLVFPVPQDSINGFRSQGIVL